MPGHIPGIYDSDWGVGTEIKFDEEIGYE